MKAPSRANYFRAAQVAAEHLPDAIAAKQTPNEQAAARRAGVNRIFSMLRKATAVQPTDRRHWRLL